ncbi:hypothetical protein [Methyloglobulus sp.]|uniref:hypothetical protein n=1 Tax=Methyloglobulus sp. TaxID=2518622 RepID=UPI0032B77BCB
MKNRNAFKVIRLFALVGLGLHVGEASAKILFAGGHSNVQVESLSTTSDTGTLYYDLGTASGIQSLGTFTTTVPNQLVRVILDMSSNGCTYGSLGADSTHCVDTSSSGGGGSILIDNALCVYGGQCFRRVAIPGKHSIRVRGRYYWNWVFDGSKKYASVSHLSLVIDTD